MSKKTITRILAALLVLCLALGIIAPAVYATEAETNEAAAPAETTEEIAVVSDDAGEIAAQAEEPVTRDYASFLSNLKILEGYANSYYATNDTHDTGKLVVNFIRTGVERYTEGLWNTLAGEEITDFVKYVETQDAANGTKVMALRNLYGFKLPNGDVVDFGHMFGCMNISYITSHKHTADLSGWAGDLCDLMLFTSDEYRDGTISGTMDEMADVIRTTYFGVDAEDAFGMDDFYGDMDGYYLINEYKANSTTFSKLMEGRFTAAMDSADRAEYFLKNRFDGLLTQEDVRNAIYGEFKANVALDVLKADYGVSELDELGEACCYAFADYLYGLAGDTLTGESSGEGEGDGEGEDDDNDKVMDNDFYSEISSYSTTLAPGIVQTNKFAITADNKQIAYYIAEVDIAREDVSVHANYMNNDPSQGWGMARVVDQMAAAQERHSDPNSPLYVENYNTIVGVNADFYNMSTGKPSGALVMEGVQYNPVGSENFFAVLKDGSAVIGAPSDWSKYEGQVQEAVGGSIFLVKDGKSVVTTTNNYYLDRASRTCVGIKADGKVVLMVLDGRQEPFSCGGSAAEIAQIMVDAGCVIAINLDGGGSTTFAAKPEGSDTVKVVSSPSDGFARSVSSSLVVVSTAKTSNEFDHTLITTEADYLTVGTAMTLNAVGVSASGNAAEIPAGTAWDVSDSDVGTITNGVFTAKAEGEVEIQSVLNGKVVGSKKLYVVTPDTLSFEKDTLNVIYGVPTELPLQATYNGNPVAINGNDVSFRLSVTTAGSINGLTFTGNEKSGARNIIATVNLKANSAVKASLQIVLYKEGETSFDFSQIDGGDRHLAWTRDISNSTTEDDYLYHIADADEDMVIDYTFALDMEAVDIPEELADIVYMLPGADVEGASAWTFLLQLAERVSVLTSVTVTAQFDQDLEVDISEMEVINEYFYLKDKTLDENNVLTATFGWVDQDAAIDPKTANPLCILHGITAVPKDNAAWDAEDQMKVINTGDVKYNIYLRANALYAFALNEDNQAKYRLIPFENKDVIIGGVPERGASFANTYATFNDTFLLDKTNRNGWVEKENFLYYYQNNVPLTGIQKLPGYEEPGKEFFYEFSDEGTCIGTVTGLMEYNGDLYYAIRGEIQKGWKTLPTADGQKTYFFHTVTGAALDGKHTIGDYTYIFTDKVLTRGHLETNSAGTHYMWAGQWITQAWVTVDGRTAYAGQNGYFFTGLRYTYSPDGVWTYYAFGEDGFLMSDFSGLYDYEGDTYLIEKGIVAKGAWTVKVGNYFYYVNSEGKVVKNRTNFVIGKDAQHDYTNGLITAGPHNIDAQGRITDPQGVEIEIPDEEFDIAFANMTLGNSLAMNFAFEQEPIEDRTGCYAVITQVFADGRENKVVNIPANEWGTTRINGVAHYTLKFNGVAAKEMADSIYVCIYNANGTALSTVWEDSVRSYAMRTLNNPSSSLETQIMIVDLLNYGAAAQTYFEYNTGDLANKLLTPSQIDLATKSAVAEDHRVKGDNYKGTNLGLESQILMRMAFGNVSQDMYAVISFTNHTGKQVEVIVEGSEFVMTGSTAAIAIDEIVVADARNLVTVTVYDSNDRQVATATDSMESYIARMAESDVLFEMILRFSDSAYNFFH